MTRDQQDREIPHADGFATKAPELDIESSDDATKAIGEFAQNGKGNAKDIPLLMRRVATRHKGEVQLEFPGLAERMNGALFLECCATFGYPTHFAVKLALEKANPAASGDAVRTYLRSREGSELLALDADPAMIDKLRKILPGPLARELPAIGQLMAQLDTRENLLRWYIDSTPVDVVAMELIQVGTPALTTSLDAINRWDWLSHVQIGAQFRSGLHAMKETTNAKAKARITEMLKGLPDDPDAGMKDVEEAATNEINAHLEDPAFSNQEVLDNAARAGDAKDLPKADLDKRMRGQPAADLLQYAYLSNDLVKAIELLLTAPDVGADHVMSAMARYLWSSRLEVIANDKLRPKLRKVLGKTVPILDLFPESKAEVHADIMKDDALAAWALEMKEPRQSLWIAAGSAAGEKRGLRAIKDARGLDWILQLPTDADTEQLRRLSLVLDGKHKAHIDKLVGDRPFKSEPGEWDAKAIDPATKNADDVQQFTDASSSSETSEEDVLGRLSDLEPDERATMAKDPATLDTALHKLNGDNLIRAVYQLQPTIAQLLSTKLHFETRLISYLRTRPASEEIEAASSAKLSKLAAEMFDRSPFIVFPALLEPGALATAIGKNKKLLPWIFEAAEPNQALAVLSQEPAKAKAVEAMEYLDEPMKQFPRYKHLLPEGRAGVETITKSIGDDGTREQLKDYKANKGEAPEKEVEKDGKNVHDAAQEDSLWNAINALKDPDPNTLLALVRNYPKDHLAILAGNHQKAVTTLREQTNLGPQIVFPEVTPMQLMAFPNARSWLMIHEAAFVTLHLAAKDAGALKYLGRMIDAPDQDTTNWLELLPRGAGLDAAERTTLDNLRAHVKTAEGLRRLFRIRFDVEIEDTYDLGRTTDLWNALRRLPPAQVNQKRIEKFTRDDLGPTTPGLWQDPKVVMSTDEELLEKDDVGYSNTPELTKAQIMSYYGLDEAAFTKALDKTNGFIEQVGSGFKVKRTHVRQFESTVLHEVGHSIDEILGEKTELVYDIAGWKNHGIDEVEQWADDMGALAGVKGKQRQQIVEAWRQSLRSFKPVREMVPTDHPAVDSSLASVPLVKAGIDGAMFYYKEKRQVGDRVGVLGNNQGTIATVPVATADIAPSEYSMSAPAEFFAECYVEYYRGYDGTAKTNNKKGGNLPPKYRTWFDANVDKLELNPHRYVKDDAGDADTDGPPSQSASAAPKPKKNG